MSGYLREQQASPGWRGQRSSSCPAVPTGLRRQLVEAVHVQTLKHLTGLFAEPVATTTAQQHVEASASLRPEGARDKERERERENQFQSQDPLNVLQKLGKADETRDSAFEELVANFNKQMTEGSKVQRDLKAYLAAVKGQCEVANQTQQPIKRSVALHDAMHDASRRLQDCLADMYEPDWFGKEELDAQVEDTDTLWMEYHQNLTDKSLLGLDTYLAQFPEIKARLAKRDRKLVDFDSARHHFASLQKGKKKDEAKIAKPAALLEMAAPSWAQGLISAHQVAQTNLSYNQAEEELGRAQRIFEELNVELQDELPVLWDSRVGVYVDTFHSLAGHEEKFHREMSKSAAFGQLTRLSCEQLSHNLNDIMTKLEEQRQLNQQVQHDSTNSQRPLVQKRRHCSYKERRRKEFSSSSSLSSSSVFSEEANHSQASSPAPKKPGPPPSRPPPRLSPSPDPKQQIDALLEDEAAAPDSHSDPKSTTQQRDERGAESLSQQDAEQEAQSGWDHADPAEGQEGGAEERERAHQTFCQPDWDEGGAGEGPGGWGEEDEESSVTNGADAELPPGFLYKVSPPTAERSLVPARLNRVKAVHEYTATDNDELELKVGDAVLVLAFDNPEEQVSIIGESLTSAPQSGPICQNTDGRCWDDGWLLGVKEAHWFLKKDISAKGVFPENFTQKV
ncbi:hypothetical protein CCH79_00020056 [Gambusia affinis]|uniref:BAR domain-containing protein n=1 Tax=Gambusia affinis TaxID=33528 RepID=A0A315UX91_GAMAF|nr:hypothetical protein CCH79_00020056 [Gambusia affinis]